MHPPRPYHATCADRIALTEAGLGRKVWAARELPDDLARALWWKRRRWYFDDRRFSLAYDDPAAIGAEDEYHEARSKHDLLIRELWFRRRLDRENRAWAHLFSDTATDRALEEAGDA